MRNLSVSSLVHMNSLQARLIYRSSKTIEDTGRVNLSKLMGPDDIEEAVSEYFLFVARRDLVETSSFKSVE